MSNTELSKEIESLNYEKVKGSRVRTDDAKEIGKIFESMEEEDGVIAQDVVEAAKDPKSVLHKYFTWDDRAAAQKQRLMEAGYLIRSVNMRVVYAQVVVDQEGITSQESREVTVRMLQSTKNDTNDGYVYRSTFKVLGDPEKATECYHNMYTYLIGAFRKFHTIDKLATDLEEIETIIINLASKLGKTKKDVESHIARIKKGI